MHLAALQFDIAWENRGANFAKVTSLLESNPPPPGALVALPEMFPSGFSMNVAAIAEDDAHTIENFCRSTSRRFGIHLVAGLPVFPPLPPGEGRGEGERRKALNQALITNPAGEPIARYHKLHPYSHERDHYTPGNEIITFPYHGATAAPFICYDLRFPEAFRAAMRRGAEILIVIANWPAARIEHWLTLARARAIENQSYVLAVNRVGADPTLTYPGRSLIIDYKGAIVADAGGDEKIISAEINVRALREYRSKLPFLRDGRRDLTMSPGDGPRLSY